MVLLTAVNNIRHYRGSCSGKGGYVQSHVGVDVKYVEEGSEAYCTSDYHQIMEIERYYAAFPALGQTRSCVEEVPICANDSLSKNVKFAEPGCNGDINGNHGHSKSRTPKHTPPQSPHLSVRKKNTAHAGVHGNTNGYHHCKTKQPHPHSKRSPKFPHPKSPKKRESESDHRRERTAPEHRKPKPIKIRDSKPWKHIPDIKVKKCSQYPKTIEHETKEVSCPADKPFISDQMLADILGPVQHASTTYDQSNLESASTLWTPGKEGSSNPWEFDELGATCMSPEIDRFAPGLFPSSEFTKASANANGDDVCQAKSWNADYDMIEQSLASFKFCEDISEEPTGSRLAPLFRENPFCYMMKHGTHADNDAGDRVRKDAFTCRHCEETYEVVLESEAKTPQKYYSNLFNHVDNRLDFDWTKYHPPPWSTSYDNSTEQRTCTLPTLECDCDYCRSRIWRKSCKWCGTPM